MSLPPLVICTGSICADILTQPVDEVRWEATTWIDRIEFGLGGNGAASSYTMAKLGARVRLFGAVGMDAFGELLLDRLSAAGVDTGGVRRVEEPTSASTVLVRPDGARALLHRPGASSAVTAADIEFPNGSRHFHLANVFGLPQLRPVAADLLARAQAGGLTTSLDTGWDARGEWLKVIGPCLPHVDVMLVNEAESAMLSGRSDAAEASRQFADLGAKTIVTKLGAQGCLVVDASEAFRAGGYAVKAVDTTGAGDCFAGAFVSAWAAGASLPEAAQLANAVGALNVQSLGGVTGIRSRAETLEWMNQNRNLVTS